MKLNVPGANFLDFLAVALLVAAASWYFNTPEMVDRGASPLVYDSEGNTYASLRCVRERSTKHLFTRTRDRFELRDSVEIIDWDDLYRYAKPERTGRLVEYLLPEPDPTCTATLGFVEMVPRWDYFFGGRTTQN